MKYCKSLPSQRVSLSEFLGYVGKSNCDFLSLFYHNLMLNLKGTDYLALFCDSTRKDLKGYEMTAFDHQAAGHKGDIFKVPGKILKRYNEREYRFYLVINEFPSISSFFPEFYGRVAVEDASNNVSRNFCSSLVILLTE